MKQFVQPDYIFNNGDLIEVDVQFFNLAASDSEIVNAINSVAGGDFVLTKLNLDSFSTSGILLGQITADGVQAADVQSAVHWGLATFAGVLGTAIQGIYLTDDASQAAAAQQGSVTQQLGQVLGVGGAAGTSLTTPLVVILLIVVGIIVLKVV